MVVPVKPVCEFESGKQIGMASREMDYSAVSEAIKRLKHKKEYDHVLVTACNRASQILNIETC